MPCHTALACVSNQPRGPPVGADPGCVRRMHRPSAVRPTRCANSAGAVRRDTVWAQCSWLRHAGAVRRSPNALAQERQYAGHIGWPIGRWPPSAFSRPARSPGGAWKRPLRRRSCRSRRGSSRCAAYAGAVTPSLPAALALLVWRYASRRTSPSIRWASVVTTRSGSWAAGAARRWRCAGTVGALTVAPVGLSSRSGGPASPALPGGLGAGVPPLHRDSAPLRLPPCPSRVAVRGARFPIPCRLPGRSWGPLRARGRVQAAQARQGLWAPGPPRRERRPETEGSPTVPRSPSACLPRSAPPVVSWRLALSPPGRLPAGHWTPAAFPSRPLEDSPAVHNSPLFGAHSRGLPARSPRRHTPLAGMHAGALLTCWRGGEQGGLAP